MLVLGLGVGANTVVYGIVDALLLRPLPFGDRSPRLVTLHSTHPTQAQDWANSEISYPDLVDVRESATTLAGLEGFVLRNFSVLASGDAERLRGASVTPGLFPLLGVEPQLGRSFTEGDGAAPGLESVVLISDALWRRAFNGARGAVGRTITLNGRAVTVIGVMPPQFAFPEYQDVWLPLLLPRDAGRDNRGVLGVGLLREGTDLETARAELASIARTLAARYPQSNRDWGVHVLPMRDLFVNAPTRRAVTPMLVAVALVLLVGCANVASLLVARGLARQGELSLRMALGARREALVRLLMMEALVLSLLGGAMGLLIAAWGFDAVLASDPEPPPFWVHLSLDARVVAFVVALSTATAFLCGLIPAFRATRVDAAAGLQPGSRTASAVPSQRRLQGALVVGQIAMSLALLVGAMLLARSAMELGRADAGFDPRPLLSLRLYIPGDAYDAPVARGHALDRVVARIRALPGVASAAATGAIPSDDGGATLRVMPPAGSRLPGDEIGAMAMPATPALFEALGLEPLDGRTFTAREAATEDARVVVINRRLAERLWPGEPAVGRELRIAEAGAIAERRVVGVVPDVVYEELGEESEQSQLTVYMPYPSLAWRTMAVLIRARSDPASVAAAVRGAIREVDPGFAAYDMMTMEERRIVTQWGERFIGRTFAGFAIVALLLACVGAYGLTAYSAAQRTREIGLRMAIGATRQDIVRLLVGRGATLAAAGVLIGLPLAAAGAMMLQGLLFRVSAWDPVFWLAAAVALFAPVLLANFLPARRAALADPAIALRHD